MAPEDVLLSNFNTSPSLYSICIWPCVRRASGFLLTAFANARSNLLFHSALLLTKGAPPKKH